MVYLLLLVGKSLLTDAAIRLLVRLPLYVVVKILEHKITQAHYFLDKCHHSVVYCSQCKKEKAHATRQKRK